MDCMARPRTWVWGGRASGSNCTTADMGLAHRVELSLLCCCAPRALRSPSRRRRRCHVLLAVLAPLLSTPPCDLSQSRSGVLPQLAGYCSPIPQRRSGKSQVVELTAMACPCAGLGYYRRARYLLEGAKYVMEQLGGQFPHTSKELQKIPGEAPWNSRYLMKGSVWWLNSCVANEFGGVDWAGLSGLAAKALVSAYAAGGCQ